MFESIPISEISTSTWSPSFIKIGGFLLKPTPPGVPVTKTSPALHGIALETYEMRVGISK
jgi:hypothetical protein